MHLLERNRSVTSWQAKFGRINGSVTIGYTTWLRFQCGLL